MDCSLTGCSIHGIFQARILEWVAMPSSRESSWRRDRTHVSYVYLLWLAGSLSLALPGKPLCIIFSLQVKVKSLSCVQLCDPMDCSLPGSSVHWIFQARILGWFAISFSRRSSRPRVWTQISWIVGRCFTVWATREVPISELYISPNTGFGKFYIGGHLLLEHCLQNIQGDTSQLFLVSSM